MGRGEGTVIPLGGLRTLKWRTKTVDPRQWVRQAIVQPCLFVEVREIDREQVAFHRKEVHVEYRIAHRAIIQNRIVRGSFVILACITSSSLTYLKLTSCRPYVKCKTECVGKFARVLLDDAILLNAHRAVSCKFMQGDLHSSVIHDFSISPVINA